MGRLGCRGLLFLRASGEQPWRRHLERGRGRRGQTLGHPNGRRNRNHRGFAAPGERHLLRPVGAAACDRLRRRAASMLLHGGQVSAWRVARARGRGADGAARPDRLEARLRLERLHLPNLVLKYTRARALIRAKKTLRQTQADNKKTRKGEVEGWELKSEGNSKGPRRSS